MMLLLYKTYLVLFVDQYKPPRNRLNCEQVLKKFLAAGYIVFEKSYP